MNEIMNPYQTMSITSMGPSTISENKQRTFAVKSTNDISDIDGARSGPKYTQYTNKAPFLQSDVLGSTSKQLIRERNTRDNSLYIDDIDGTRHQVKDRMMRTTRHVDPLMPVYDLPSFAPDVNVKTRFIKDPQTHSDIEGSNVRLKQVFATRDTMSVRDIEGAQANWRPVHTNARLNAEPHNIMQCQDVSDKANFQYISSRQSDPCNPQYYINGMEYKDDKHSRPKMPKGFIADNNQLQTRDIAGAYPGWVPDAAVRREYRNTNFVGDIPGAQADSTKHSITTNRQTNPLTPVYKALDPGEYLVPCVAPLVPIDMVRIPTIPHKVKQVDQKGSNTQQQGHGGGGHGGTTSIFGSSNANVNTFQTTVGPETHPFQLDLSRATGGGQESEIVWASNKSSGRMGVMSNLNSARSGGNVNSSRYGAPQRADSGGGGGMQFGYTAPPLSNRSNSNKATSALVMTPTQIRERNDEINLVRQLQM